MNELEDRDDEDDDDDDDNDDDEEEGEDEGRGMGLAGRADGEAPRQRRQEQYQLRVSLHRGGRRRTRWSRKAVTTRTRKPAGLSRSAALRQGDGRVRRSGGLASHPTDPSDKAGSGSMNLSDFVSKYGDLSLSGLGGGDAQDVSAYGAEAGSAEESALAEDSMSVSVQANRTALDLTSSSAGTESADGSDTTVHSLRELLGFRDSHEYETYLKSKVSRGTPSSKRFPVLHGVPVNDEARLLAARTARPSHSLGWAVRMPPPARSCTHT